MDKSTLTYVRIRSVVLWDVEYQEELTRPLTTLSSASYKLACSEGTVLINLLVSNLITRLAIYSYIHSYIRTPINPHNMAKYRLLMPG